MKKIVLTGGGTAGHVSPNLALIPHLLAQGYDISYIGTEKGIEREMISKVPEVHYYAVKSGKLRRYFSWQNFTDPFRVIAGAFQSAHLMGKIRPNVVFSKGGFVSVPVVFGAWLHHIPVVCHESDLTPGLANKLCKPVLLMMGGSLGAQSVNKVLREALPELLPQFDVCHICGKGNLDASLNDTAGYRQLEFVDKDLPDLLATADLVLSRAGSNALCEFQALGKPMLLVPYPKGASRGDQILNAQSLERRGLCRVLLQEDLTRTALVDALNSLWRDRDQLEKALRDAPPADGTKRVLEMIEEVQKR